MKSSTRKLACRLILGMFVMSPMFANAAITVADAWIPAAPPGTVAHAGYLRIVNQGTTERTLVGVSSETFQQVMVHRTVQEEGTARMVHLDELPLPIGQEIRFEPGGLHIMFIGAQQEIKPEQFIIVLMEFDDGTELSVPFVVRSR